MTSRTYHHGDLRRTLLDASLALIEEQGLDALSLREVARRAGVTHAAPYHHFADKRAVMAAIVGEGFTLLRDEMQRARDEADERADAQLAAIGKGYVSFALRHPAHFRVMFRPELCGPGYESKAGQDAWQLLEDGVAATERAGLAPAGEHEALVLLSWAVAHGFAALWLDGSLAAGAAGRKPQAIAERVFGLLGRLSAAGGRGGAEARGAAGAPRGRAHKESAPARKRGNSALERKGSAAASARASGPVRARGARRPPRHS